MAQSLSLACYSGGVGLPHPFLTRGGPCQPLHLGKGVAWRERGGSPAQSPCLGPSRVCLLRQAHPHLPCCLPGLRVLCLLRCCVRDPRARPRHQVLAQRALGLHRRPLRVPSVRQQEILGEDHMNGKAVTGLSAP